MVTEKADNKNNYFFIKLKYGPLQQQKIQPINKSINEHVLELEDDIDVFLTKIRATDESFIVRHAYSIEILFKTQERKRLGVVRNLFLKNVKLFNTQEYESYSGTQQLKYNLSKSNFPSLETVMPVYRNDFYNIIEQYKNDKNVYLKTDISKYTGSDIIIFDDYDNFYSWQKQVYSYLFDIENNLAIKPAHHREILFILDEMGNTGKSSFLKWLFTNNEKEIGLLNEATAQQLKTSLISLGKKPIYILDLPRTKSKLGTNDLLNVIESLKSGILLSAMYGKNEGLLLEPAHVIVFANHLPVGALSPDRFTTWKLVPGKNNDIIVQDISENSRKEAYKYIEKQKLKEAIDSIKEENRIQKALKKINASPETPLSIKEIEKQIKKLQKLAESRKQQKEQLAES